MSPVLAQPAMCGAEETAYSLIGEREQRGHFDLKPAGLALGCIG
jgi:hypothetical protein